MAINIAATLVVSTVLSVMVLVACGGDKSGTPETNQPGETQDVINTAPEVGASAQLTRAAILQLSGSAIDETLPTGELTVEWTQVSGPGTVTFADASKIDTTATFTAAGTYVLRLTATDGEFTVSDEVTVVVQQ